MKYRTIGNSGLKAPAIIMGCMRIGEMEEGKVAELINTALEEGINLFDHADIYGGGQAEIVFGNALKQNKIRREDIMIQSKCGIRKGCFDLSADYIVKSADDILSRLQTGYLDILFLHRPDTLMEPEEIALAFDKLQAAGKVRQFAVSNMNAGQIELIRKCVSQELTANQLQFSAAHTGMIDSGLNVNMSVAAGIDRDGGILEYARLHDMTIQTWSSLQYGFFEGTFLGNEKYEELNRVLNRIGEEQEAAPAAVAIAWILRHPAGMQAVVGSTNPKRLREMAKAADLELSREEWYEIYQAAGNVLP